MDNMDIHLDNTAGFLTLDTAHKFLDIKYS